MLAAVAEVVIHIEELQLAVLAVQAVAVQVLQQHLPQVLLEHLTQVGVVVEALTGQQAVEQVVMVVMVVQE
jgi:hypothetical protein